MTLRCLSRTLMLLQSLNEENRVVLQLHATICNEMGLHEREIKSRALYVALKDTPNASRLASQRSLAEAYVALKKWPDAVREYKKIVDSRSDSPKDLREYAAALQKADRWGEGAEVWGKVSRFVTCDHAVFVGLASKWRTRPPFQHCGTGADAGRLHSTCMSTIWASVSV